MPENTSKKKYEIEFDEHGRIRILDPELAGWFLRHAGEIECEIGVIPLLATRCNLPPPPPVNGLACPNEMCPMSINLKISPRVLQQWESFPRE